MQISTTSIAALLLAALTGQALGAPATTPAAIDNLLLEERDCDCRCNVKCQQNCQEGFAGNGMAVGACVLSCAPNCGCGEHSKC